MAGRGPAPKTTRRNKADVPTRGEWQPTPGVGWQHGPTPDPSDGLLAASRSAWATWMGAWFASHWTPDDLPVLRQIIKLFDKIERNDASSAELTQYRQLIDSYGITPKGQQDRRWAKPDGSAAKAEAPTPQAGPYAGLRVVSKTA